MARQPTGNPNGRPPREFDDITFEGLCKVQCTIDEIEAVFRTDARTLDKWCQKFYGETFSVCYKNFSKNGKSSLRRNQYNLSRTNAAMAIWLGKNWLGQKDHEEENKNRNIVINVSEKLASGIEISAEGLSNSDNQSPQLGNQESSLGSP